MMAAKQAIPTERKIFFGIDIFLSILDEKLFELNSLLFYKKKFLKSNLSSKNLSKYLLIKLIFNFL